MFFPRNIGLARVHLGFSATSYGKTNLNELLASPVESLPVFYLFGIELCKTVLAPYKLNLRATGQRGDYMVFPT